MPDFPLPRDFPITTLRHAERNVSASRGPVAINSRWGSARWKNPSPNGVDNWQHEGNDLGIKSKWNPHLYPAIDPEVKKRLQAEGKA